MVGIPNPFCPAGYLSVTDWPLLPFYGAMCGVYVLLGLLWLIFCSIHWRDILRYIFSCVFEISFKKLEVYDGVIKAT